MIRRSDGEGHVATKYVICNLKVSVWSHTFISYPQCPFVNTFNFVIKCSIAERPNKRTAVERFPTADMICFSIGVVIGILACIWFSWTVLLIGTLYLELLLKLCPQSLRLGFHLWTLAFANYWLRCQDIFDDILSYIPFLHFIPFFETIYSNW